MSRIVYFFAFALAVGLNSAQVQAQDLYGTWRGVYSPTEMFQGNNIPYRSPPYDPINLELKLHPFDAALGRYGVINVLNEKFEGAVFFGNVIEFSQNGTTLSLVTFVPEEGHPTGYSDLVAYVNGDRMQGTLNDRSPAKLPWVHMRGPIDFVRVVPEPSGLVLGAVGMAILLKLRNRRNRFGAGGRT